MESVRRSIESNPDNPIEIQPPHKTSVSILNTVREFVNTQFFWERAAHSVEPMCSLCILTICHFLLFSVLVSRAAFGF